MESERHKQQMDLLQQSLRDSWSDERPIYVGANMALYFSTLQAENQDFRAPDLFVVLDAEPGERVSWVVWEEAGQLPDVVIELLSESTEKIDRGRKKDVYERLKIPSYFVYHPFTHVLDGWSLAPGRNRYVPLEKDERGHLFCAPLGLWLGVVESTFGGLTVPYLRWLDGDRRPLKTRAEAETLRADQLAARLAEYETRFGPLPDK